MTCDDESWKKMMTYDIDDDDDDDDLSKCDHPCEATQCRLRHISHFTHAH